jgi:hypothetical protein
MINYEELKKKKIRENIKELRNNISDRSVMLKVKNWADKYDLEFNFVKHKVFTDDIFALNFVKDPGRQNFHENIAAYALESLANIQDFKLLPKGGKNAKVINHGMLVSLEQSRESISNPKTIDFEWKLKTESGRIITCYASHKYTKDKGGSQDNQFNDLKSFMQHAYQNNQNDILFFAICDGNYYQQRDRTTNMSKIEELNASFYKENKVKATTINNLFEILDLLIEDQRL